MYLILQVPSSKQVSCSREPLYSQPLFGIEKTFGVPMPFQKHSIFREHSENPINTKSTLDNPAILEQQLEALAYRKLQMEKKGLLGMQIPSTQPPISIQKLSSIPLCNGVIYSNTNSLPSNKDKYVPTLLSECKSTASTSSKLYSNNHVEANAMGPSLSSSSNILSICTNLLSDNDIDEDLPPPPSPVSAVSSSYSELRRATNVINKPMDSFQNNVSSPHKNYRDQVELQQAALNKTSSSYDSIYEPINPRPPSDALTRESCSLYDTYVNNSSIPSCSCDPNAHGPGLTLCYQDNNHQNKNIGGLRNYVLNSLEATNEFDNYGICFKCSSRVIGETSGCTAMDHIYHITCFTCTDCQINLQGKPFYALEGKPYCEYDYLQTLEKCSVCMEPILERILRATGKPYHPQCFTCVVCGKSLDGLLFTVDATNQNYCITDFHKKFAPRCCVCKHPIMPETGQEETVRVVALDRSFHLECYKCEDCGLLLSSEADGRGCYPLDDHVLCKSCNAQRVQVLTKRMTSEH
ncbi:hypothetical protein KR009_002221 [Drosophila setifemur]|nr:hypothetical protein KR009_002221 [Drosophila setifemur]